MDHRKSERKDEMKKNSKVVIGCGIVAAVCFGIVSYGHLYRGRMELGKTFAIRSVDGCKI